MYKRLLPLYRRLQDVDIDSTQPCTRVIYFPIFVSVIAIWCWLRKWLLRFRIVRLWQFFQFVYVFMVLVYFGIW